MKLLKNWHCLQKFENARTHNIFICVLKKPRNYQYFLGSGKNTAVTSRKQPKPKRNETTKHHRLITPRLQK